MQFTRCSPWPNLKLCKQQMMETRRLPTSDQTIPDREAILSRVEKPGNPWVSHVARHTRTTNNTTVTTVSDH